MSWKSIVITGLLCVVASPVLAVPSLSITNTGLDTDGNWTWNVIVTPTGGSSLAAELGLRETVTGSQLVDALIGTTGTSTVWDTNNPGTRIFDWEVLDGEGDYVGLQENPATDEVFAALGSAIQPAATGAQLLTIKTSGPLATRTNTSLQLLGKYGTGGTNGRIAEGLGTPAGTNYSNFSGTATRNLVVGDLNLSGLAAGPAAVNGTDFGILLQSLNKSLGARNWSHGDLNGTTGGAEVNGTDFGLLLTCLNKTTPACSTSVNTPLNVVGVAGGAGSVSGSAVPEPGSVVLLGLAVLGMLGMNRRRK